MGSLRTQMVHACLDAVEIVVAETARSKGRIRSGPKWPANLILGEEAESRVIHSEEKINTVATSGARRKKAKPRYAAQRRDLRTAV